MGRVGIIGTKSGRDSLECPIGRRLAVKGRAGGIREDKVAAGVQITPAFLSCFNGGAKFGHEAVSYQANAWPW